MPNITTRMGLTSTTIQIRNEDAKSNFMNFEQRWEAAGAIKVTAKINKADNFDDLYESLPLLEKDYINLICNQTKFDTYKTFYIPDWVFLSGSDSTTEEAVCRVVSELFTGLYDVSKSLFKITVSELDLDPGVEVGFPVE